MAIVPRQRRYSDPDPSMDHRRTRALQGLGFGRERMGELIRELLHRRTLGALHRRVGRGLAARPPGRAALLQPRRAPREPRGRSVDARTGDLPARRLERGRRPAIITRSTSTPMLAAIIDGRFHVVQTPPQMDCRVLYRLFSRGSSDRLRRFQPATCRGRYVL